MYVDIPAVFADR